MIGTIHDATRAGLAARRLRSISLLAVIVMCGVLAVALAVVLGKLREARRVDFIRTYAFPKGLIQRLQQRRPGLPAEDGGGKGHQLGVGNADRRGR